MESESNGKVSFSWDMHWQCNYRCPYCWWHGRWEHLSGQNYYPGVEKLIQAWKRIYQLYGCANVNISGGEPMTYPGFFEFLPEMTKYHSIVINTNLSGDVKKMTEVLKNSVERVKFNATFHPLFADFDKFAEKAGLLQEAEFYTCVTYLAWPPQIKDIPAYREKFSEIGFRLCVLSFWGDYNAKKYPDSYTREESEIISPNLGKRSGEQYQIKPVITLGKVCNAGHVYATIHPDGKALRCGGGSWEKEDTAVGNLFDEEFKLWPQARTCTSRYCPCNEWAFLLAKDE
jgi:MoaA/NifB/PqqE/SkfB family radical SAM enzyme